MDSDNRPEGARWIAKELSWLSFNERVLQEAADKAVPLIQRIRYLGIFSNNQDEFFRVRVADVRRLATFSSPSRQEYYKQLLEEIRQQVLQLQQRFDRVYLETLADLAARRIYLVDESQIANDAEQMAFVRDYFHQHIRPALMPILLDDGNPVPILNETSIYLAIKLVTGQQVRYALLEVPTAHLPRFVRLPPRHKQRGKVLMVLENLIRSCLPEVFLGVFPVEEAEAYTIKLTRDAELELGEEINESLFDKVSESLRRRRKADAVRFLYDAAMPKDLLNYLTRRLGLGRLDSLIPGGRYHNAKDFMDFPNLGPAYLDLKPLPVIPVPELESAGNLFKAIAEQDVLLYYPYHSFSAITDLLKTAAIDPAVRTIQVSLYRVAPRSRIVDALLNAVANNKKVTAVIELQARFDEAANIELSQRLRDGGVNVILGAEGLKIHAKLILIGRMEGTVLRYYSHIGTGNFNEKTARVYTDFSLLTFNQEIGEEVAKVFDYIRYPYRRYDIHHLIVSPANSRTRLLELIDREVDHAHAGRKSGIIIKCNNLVDRELVERLYKASSAGVPIRLIVRGMCSLLPGVPGLSDNIEGISIVDRFLEHPRVYVFHNGGDSDYFLASADLMTRNIDHRIEVMAPVRDPVLCRCIRDILDIQWADNVKARVLDAAQSNKMRERSNGVRRIQSQEVIHHYLATGHKPKLPKPKLSKLKH